MNTFMLIMRILTVLPGIIKAVQEMVPADSGHGSLKLKAALEMLTNLFGDISKALPVITQMIEILVGLGKTAGALPGAPAEPIDKNIVLN